MFTWNMGISAIRGMTKDRLPDNIDQVISLLSVASAMQTATMRTSNPASRDDFLEDLDRWRSLAIQSEQRDLYDKIVFEMWGKYPSLKFADEPTSDFSTDFKHLIQSLRRLIRAMQCSLQI